MSLPTDAGIGVRGIRHNELEVRRQLLLARSARLRGDLTLQAQALERPLAWADGVREIFAWLRQHPEVPVGVAVTLIVIRPSRAWRWTARLWSAWRLFRRAQRLLA